MALLAMNTAMTMKGLVCSHMIGVGYPMTVDAVTEWAIRNDYVQCAGCLGYGPGLETNWVYVESQTYFPFCTDECYDKYMKLPLSE